MAYVKRVNAKAGEFVVVDFDVNGQKRRVYFDFNPNYYGHGEGGITNSLRKKFPILRKDIVKMVEEKYFKPWWVNRSNNALAYAIASFYAGAVDSVRDFSGNIVLER